MIASKTLNPYYRYSNLLRRQGRRFPQELLYQIIPLVENRYSTYAVTTDEEGLEASRAHRGFGGFSMGARQPGEYLQNASIYLNTIYR